MGYKYVPPLVGLEAEFRLPTGYSNDMRLADIEAAVSRHITARCPVPELWIVEFNARCRMHKEEHKITYAPPLSCVHTSDDE